MQQFDFSIYSDREIEKMHSLLSPFWLKIKRGVNTFEQPIFWNKRTATPQRQREIFETLSKDFPGVASIILNPKKEAYDIKIISRKKYIRWFEALRKVFKGVLVYGGGDRMLHFFENEIYLKENKWGSILHTALVSPNFCVTMGDMGYTQSSKMEEDSFRKSAELANQKVEDELKIEAKILLPDKDKWMINVHRFRGIFIQ